MRVPSVQECSISKACISISCTTDFIRIRKISSVKNKHHCEGSNAPASEVIYRAVERRVMKFFPLSTNPRGNRSVKEHRSLFRCLLCTILRRDR